MTNPAPWWANDPVLNEIRRRTAEEFGIGLEHDDEPVTPFVPDPVIAELVDGACWRELASARDGLASARDRYDAAVLEARTAGFSWAEIGRVLGVSKQQLHRRFTKQQQGRP